MLDSEFGANNMYNYTVTHVTNVSDVFNSVRNQNVQLFSNVSDRYITLKILLVR